MNTIKPGSTVTVKVIKTPTASAAAKTIVRVLSKDPAAQKENLRLAQVRARRYRPRIRGGRLYGGQLVKQHRLKGSQGESGTILATVDVIRDLNSVRRFVEIETA